MEKLSAVVVILVVISIAIAVFIPAVSADVDSDGDGIPDFKEFILGTNASLWTNTDGIVYTEASVNPGEINLMDTTQVKLTVVSNNTVVYSAKHVLPEPDKVDYVEESASITPDVIGQTLEWGIDDLTPVSPWVVSFDVKPLNPGRQAVNVVPDSEATYGIGKVTGGGCWIQSPGNPDKHANFGFVAKWKGEEEEPSGNMQFIDHDIDMNVHSESIDTLAVNYGEHMAYFTGTARVDDTSGYNFTVRVWDLGEPGKDHDKFTISITGPEDFAYSANGTLGGGNIQIHDSPDITLAAINVSFPAVFVEVETTPGVPPVASFTVSNLTPATNQSIIFDASASYDPDGEIVTYRWSFNFSGDDNWDIEGNVVKINHSYSKIGNYRVELEVEDDDEAKNRTTININVSKVGEGEEISDNVTWNGNHTFEGLSNTEIIGSSQYITATAYGIKNNLDSSVDVRATLSVDGEPLAVSEKTLDPNEQNGDISVSATWIPMSSGVHSVSLVVRDGPAWVGPTNDPEATTKVFIEKIT